MKATIWNRFIHPVTGYFRKKRGLMMARLFPSIENYYICDVGGSIHFWEKINIAVRPENIKIYNISDSETEAISRRASETMKVHIYDGNMIPEPDNTFDLVVCNSVIEHVPKENREQLVRELMRIGKQLYLQTPAYEFVIEPHFVMPFIHWFPRRVGYFLALVSPWRIMSRPSNNTIDEYFWGTQLLTKKDIDQLFPGCVVHREKVCGITKSYMVVSNGDEHI